MPAARCRDGIYQLVGDEPPGGKYLPDSLPRLGRHLQRRLEMRLDDELLHADGRGLLPELLQHLHQLVVDAHRQVSRQARPQPHALQLGIFFTVGTRLVGLALAAGHAVDRLEDIAQRLVLAHQGVAARDEDVAQLRVLLEISHQAAQFVIPALLGAQALELEIEPFALKVVHPLARGAQPAAGTPHRIGDQDRHFGITAVDIVPVGQQPPGRIGFSGLDNVLLLPGADIPVGLDQLRRIEDIAADRLVVVRFAGDVQQREVIGRGEERHPLFAPSTAGTWSPPRASCPETGSTPKGSSRPSPGGTGNRPTRRLPDGIYPRRSSPPRNGTAKGSTCGSRSSAPRGGAYAPCSGRAPPPPRDRAPLASDRCGYGRAAA